MDKKEKPFTIYGWDDLREELRVMKPRSKLYEIVKAEVLRRGNWKQAPRGLHGLSGPETETKPPRKT